MVKFNFNDRQKTKFNPSKFGKVWASIFFKNKPGLHAVGDANQPVIGELNIDGKRIDLTFSECNKLIETLEDAKEVSKTSKRLGQTQNSAGSPIGFMEVQSTMYNKE